MFKLREADLMFARKNELFKDFEQTLDKDFDDTGMMIELTHLTLLKDYLRAIYEEYSKINVVVPSLEENEGEGINFFVNKILLIKKNRLL